MKVLYDPSFWGKKIFPHSIWESKVNKVLLTFDDGPIPETTEMILQYLNGKNIKAVFFCVGENIKKYPDLAGSILSQGHAIGNHTYNHKNLLTLEINSQIEQVRLFDEVYASLFGQSPLFCRPPKGRIPFNYKTVFGRGKINVMWNLLTYDYKNDINIVKFAVRKYLKNNSIIVLHDSIKSKNIIIDSLEFIAEEVKNRGYEFGAPEECLR